MSESANNEVVAGAPTRASGSLLPDLGDIIFLCLLYLTIGLLPNFVLNDGSTGWHLVTGQYILQNLSIPHQDLISYTFPDKPWVAYEWLPDVVAAGLDKVGGLKLLAVASCSAIAGLFLLLYEDCRAEGCHFLPAAILTVVGALTSSVHWLARPILFTFFGVYVFSRSLEAFRRGKLSAGKLQLILGFTTLVWVNSHPAFLMGFALTIIYLCGEAACAIVATGERGRQAAWRRTVVLFGALSLSVLVSLINPYGAGLYSYVSQYLHQSAVLSSNTEFMSPSFHGEFQSTCLELLFLALALALAASRVRPALSPLLCVLAFAHLALSGLRNEPVFVIVALPFIARTFASASPVDSFREAGSPSGGLVARVKECWIAAGKNFDEVEAICRLHAIPLTVVLFLVVSCFFDGKVLGRTVVSSSFDERSKPTATLEYIRREKLPWAHGFNFDNWGGYIRYVSGERVFIDDRSDFYGEPFYLEYGQVSLLEPGWQHVLDKYKIQWVLFPTNSKLACRLKEEPGWKLVDQDSAASLFLRCPSK